MILIVWSAQLLKIGAIMNNKLDTFNKDKIKCEKCKDYYDDCSEVWKVPRSWYPLLCDDCYDKWFKAMWSTKNAIPCSTTERREQELYQDFLK